MCSEPTTGDEAAKLVEQTLHEAKASLSIEAIRRTPSATGAGAERKEKEGQA